MGADVWRGEPPAGWDDAVAALGGSVFHSEAWAAHQRRRRGWMPIFLRQDGDGAAAAVAFLRASPRPVLSAVLRDLVVPAHPAGAPGAARALMTAIEALADQLRCRRVLLGSMASGGSAFAPAAHGYREVERIEFLVDLTRELDVLWRGLARDQRERVRRLPREGVDVDVDGSPASVAGLRMAREGTLDRRAARGQGYELEDQAFYADLHEGLVKRGAARLLVARRDDEVLGALFLATFRGRACSLFSGSTEAGYRLGVQAGLYWTAVETLRAEGFTELNRGGVPASAEREDDPLHGIYRFKRRLGAVPVRCRSGDKVIRPVQHALAGALERLRPRRRAA